MHYDSLLLWLRHFPISNTITSDFVDTCGSAHGPTIGVVAGENFDDVWNGVQDNHVVVTGLCPTVSLSGGWIQGGGLGLTSRMYGYGVDQARSFDVVTATDGTLVKADACTNSDLFWALRGGGGGNYGIVTNVEYQLHPSTPVTVLEFAFDGVPIIGGIVSSRDGAFMTAWMGFIVDFTPTMDRRWGGLWGPLEAKMFFLGTLEEALTSDLVLALDMWYENEVESLNPPFGRPSTRMTEYESFFEARGGQEAFQNPATDPLPAIAVPQLFGTLGPYARIITNAVLDLPGARDLLIRLCLRGDISPTGNYFLGGRTNDFGPSDTALHPAMRDAVLMVQIATRGGGSRLSEFTGNEISCLCYNHHSPLQPDWEQASWGSNFRALAEIKQERDPNHIFNVNRGVGHRGGNPIFQFGCLPRNPLPNLSVLLAALARGFFVAIRDLLPF